MLDVDTNCESGHLFKGGIYYIDIELADIHKRATFKWRAAFY